MVSTGDDLDHNVRLIHPLFGDVIRADTPAVRIDAIRQRLVDAFVAAGVTDDDRARLRVALWRVQLDGVADGEELRWGARHALRMWDGATAEVLASAAARVDPSLESFYLMGEALRALKRGEEAAAAFAAADALEGSDAVRAQNAYGWSNVLAYLLGRPADARQAAQRVLAKLTDPLARQHVLGALLAEGLATIDELAVELQDEQLAPSTAFGVGLDSLLKGRTTDALGRIDAALLTEPAWIDEYPTLSVPIRLLRIWALAVAGRPDEASGVASALYDESVRTGVDYPRGTWCLARGMIDVLRGSMGEATVALREGASALAVLDPNLLRPMYAYLAMSLAVTPDRTAQAEQALAASRSAADGVDRVFGPEVLRAEAWLHAARGDLRTARDAATEASRRHRESAAFVLEAMALYDVVRFGAPTRAVERLGELAATSQGELLRLLAEHARALDREDGQALLAVAIRFRDAGFALFAAEAAVRAVAAAAHRGSRVVSATAREVAERAVSGIQPVATPALQHRLSTTLTVREREVALLAAGGLSSPQIARQLSVSTRTVDNLLGRVYAKLHLSGRSDLRAVLSPTTGGAHTVDR